MLDNKLIESALQLTGKTMEDVSDEDTSNRLWFRIDRFCYYLISEDFIKSYKESPGNYGMNIEIDFLYAIQDYQSWNEQPLIELLSPVCIQDKNESIGS